MASTNHSGTNIELVREAFATFWDNALEAFFALFEENFEWIVSTTFPYGGQYRGRDEVMKGDFLRIQADWETFTHELDRLIEVGDTIVALGQDESTPGGTG